MAGSASLAANIAGLYVESFLYGLFFILSLTSIYLILKYNGDQGTTPRSNSPLRRPMLIGTILLFLVCTTHWILTFVRFFQGFIYFRGGLEPEAFFNSKIELTEILQIGFFLAGLVIADVMFTYRLWIICNRNIYIVIFPICTVFALTICSVAVTYQFAKYTSPSESAYLQIAARWIVSDCVFTLCTNVYCTSIIAWRIWTIHKVTASFGHGKRKGVLSIISIFVESAALCTAWTIFYFVAYEVKSELHDFVEGTWATVSGIAFTLITVRIGLGWSIPTETNPTAARVLSRHPPRFAAPSSLATGMESETFAIQHNNAANEKSGVKDTILVNTNRTIDLAA